jgi:hypothetical protein
MGPAKAGFDRPDNPESTSAARWKSARQTIRLDKMGQTTQSAGLLCALVFAEVPEIDATLLAAMFPLDTSKRQAGRR